MISVLLILGCVSVHQNTGKEILAPVKKGITAKVDKDELRPDKASIIKLLR